MITVFDYTDYRKFLQDAIQHRKKNDRTFTYMHVASRTGFRSPGFITQILKGTTNISRSTTEGFARLFELDRWETDYFRYMVLYNQSSSHEEKKSHFQKMLRYRRGKVHRIDPTLFEFYDKWYYSAVRAVIAFYPFAGDYGKLGKMLIPAIKKSEAKRALEVLQRLDFIKQDENGRYSVTDKVITTGNGSDSVSINNFVVNTLELAGDALYRFPREERSLSSLTVNVSDEGYEQISRLIDGVRSRIIDIVRKDRNTNRVYQVNFQLFPLSDRYISGKEQK